MSLAATVLDYYDDQLVARQPSGMSKLAAAMGKDAVGDLQFNDLKAEQIAALPSTEFGLVMMTKRGSALRRFPLNDPGNTWMSSYYFQRSHEKLAFPARVTAAFFIKKACAVYKVPSSKAVDDYAALGDDKLLVSNRFSEASPWAQVKMAAAELIEKQAAAAEFDATLAMPDSNFALVIKNGDGETIRKYAMPNAAHVKTAASYFDKFAMQLAPQHRHQFAAAVKNRAAELSVKLADDSLVEKWAGDGWNRNVDAHLEHRKSLLPHNEPARKTLEKLAASLRDATPADAAETLRVFDEAAGLSRYYSKGLADPYQSTMGKVASGWSADIDGSTLTEGDLNKVAESPKLAGYLGAGFANQFKSNPVEIFESLPDPEKVLIKQISEGTA